MGCDIHIYVERKIGNKWYDCDYFVPNVNSIYNSDFVRVELFGDRNYSLFATLANVRNYGNTEYISEPKGLPNDVSDYVDSEYDSWFCDAHSASHLTLQELIDFQREKHPLKHRGMLSPTQQEQFDHYGILPDHWCQGTNQSGFEFREWEEDIDVLEPIIDGLKRLADQLNIIYSWGWDSENTDIRESAYRAAANIRIVFWFDN